MATKERLVRFTILAYRNPALSEEAFHHHWTYNHAPLVREWLARHGIVRYTQYHTHSSVRQQAIATFGMPEAAFATYDGFVEILMRRFEDFKTAQADPFYIDKVAPDEAYMSDPARTQIIVGWEEVYVLDGKVVDLPPGEAGVVKG